MSADLSGMRWHELALQHWLHSNFYVAEGTPVPVVFATPMDAFAQFKQLWANADNPFQYLLDAKDSDGTPLYQPFPAPAKYPLIGISRKGCRMRPTQNYSIHRYRRINWPTADSAVSREDLAQVSTARMPMAWDFSFQLDFFSLRLDTQAVFIQELMGKFWMTGGATPRCFARVDYPGYFGPQMVQLVLDGSNIDNSSQEEPAEREVTEHRATASITMEGWIPDLNVVEFPAFWTNVFVGSTPATPTQLKEIFVNRSYDMRVGKAKSRPILFERDNVPPPSA